MRHWVATRPLKSAVTMSRNLFGWKHTRGKNIAGACFSSQLPLEHQFAMYRQTGDTGRAKASDNHRSTYRSRGHSVRLLVTAICLLHIFVLGGCTRPPQRLTAPSAPSYHIDPVVLRAIDEQILDASVVARHEAGAYARLAMDEWRERVRRQIETEFIPWYSDYWTQQGIATRAAWYKVVYSEGEATPEDRLVGYLQEQFYHRVLVPVSDFVDPHAVMIEATDIYLQVLERRLEPLPSELAIPAEAFNQHLRTIPAIRDLVVDRDGGVCAMVSHMSEQIEDALASMVQNPTLPSVPVPTERH